MLELEIPAKELYNEHTNEFMYTKPVTLRLEHSLVSLSKWEATWKKPFLLKDYVFPREEMVDYVRCMTISQNVDPDVYRLLTPDELKKVNAYIETDQTATKFSNLPGKSNSQVITSELIYYYMTAHNIPFECQKWHLSRLMTLIQICSIKNSPDNNKMTRQAIFEQNRALNAARRKAGKTKG